MKPTMRDIEQALGWAGFRQLLPTESSAGPFIRQGGEQRFVRLDPTTRNTAFVIHLDHAPDVLSLMEQQDWGMPVYDINIEHRAHDIESLNEFRFLYVREQGKFFTELGWRGYHQNGSFWTKIEPCFEIPAPGADYAGEIFPCLGWVPLPTATSEFHPAEQRIGFCSKVVPVGATSVRDVRGYDFIYDDFPRRAVLRRQIIALIDPEIRFDAKEIVDDALALSYGAM